VKHGNTTLLKPFFRYLSAEEYATLPREMKTVYLRMAVRAAAVPPAKKPAAATARETKPKA